MKNYLTQKLILFIVFLSFLSLGVNAQEAERKAMAKLSFMVGEWKGKAEIFNKNSTLLWDVKSEVKYDLNGTLLVIRVLEKEGDVVKLRLHTIINYNAKEDKYYYSPFSQRGLSRSFVGKSATSQKIIFALPDNSYRLIFQKDKSGAFVEYGERNENGKWVMTFRNTLVPTSGY
ncbi:hypothetical protein BKI52_28050 [marine bacterium AO1-C]|nr:hypothetical protein BKI52_28050 [marine bacterium AO1-C]